MGGGDAGGCCGLGTALASGHGLQLWEIGKEFVPIRRVKTGVVLLLDAVKYEAGCL